MIFQQPEYIHSIRKKITIKMKFDDLKENY